MKDNTNKLLIVEDFTKISEAVRSGKLLPEEAEAIFAQGRRDCSNFNTEDGEQYLSLYGKPEFLLGASDSGAIMRVSPFKSRYMLQLEKLGEASPVVTPGVQWRYDLGHEAESFVGSMGARMLRKQGINVRYEPCESGFICTKYRHVLIHPDCFLIDGDTIYLGEVKTAANTSPHWLNSFSRGIIPEDYQTQVQVEMEVLSQFIDIDKCYVLAWNKTGDEDGFKQLCIERDSEYAQRILSEMEKFYEDTINGKLYDDDEIFPEEAAVIYKDVDKSLGYVDIPKNHEDTLLKLSELQEEKAQLKADIADVEADIREIEKQEKLLKSRLYSGIGKAPGGTMQIGSDIYHIDVTRSCSFDEEVRKMIADEFPEAWERIKEYKPLIRTKVTKVSAADGTGEVV